MRSCARTASTDWQWAGSCRNQRHTCASAIERDPTVRRWHLTGTIGGLDYYAVHSLMLPFSFLLRVFSLPPTPTPVSTDAHRSFYLSVPGIEKNFLISPPGSPPVGWEPVREDPPNTETLAEDLVAALTTIRHADADAEDVADYKMDEAMDLQVWDDTDGTAHTPHILLTPQRDVPGVSIANYTNITLPTAHTEPRQSSLPTKATSESMGGRKSHTRTPSLVVPDEVGGLGASTTITPTARPPV